ncbi:MAG: hypothetical protein ACLFPP_13270 [Spirochaetaceae bacterium]
MRTTLNVDDDVLKRIDDLARREGCSRVSVVNETLRRGLDSRETQEPRERVTISSRDLGRCLIPSLDDISEVLSVAEGDDYR